MVMRRSRLVDAPAERVWELVSDPHHLPRWWPGVQRVEGVGEDHWTEVFLTRKGRAVRLDFSLLQSEPLRGRSWEQDIAGTPFERVLNRNVFELALDPGEGGEGTMVTVSQTQKLRGYSRTGGFMLRRATRRRLEEALDGLARIA